MVLDSSAVVAMHTKEPGYMRLFERVRESQTVLIGSPTLFESAMVVTSRVGPEARAVLEAAIREMGVIVVPFSQDHVNQAITAFLRFGKGRHRAALNFGDCMSYAVARVARMPLLYVGNDFSQTDIASA
jgi:ribonuclease VapC